MKAFFKRLGEAIAKGISYFGVFIFVLGIISILLSLEMNFLYKCIFLLVGGGLAFVFNVDYYKNKFRRIHKEVSYKLKGFSAFDGNKEANDLLQQILKSNYFNVLVYGGDLRFAGQEIGYINLGKEHGRLTTEESRLFAEWIKDKLPDGKDYEIKELTRLGGGTFYTVKDGNLVDLGDPVQEKVIGYIVQHKGFDPKTRLYYIKNESTGEMGYYNPRTQVWSE